MHDIAPAHRKLSYIIHLFNNFNCSTQNSCKICAKCYNADLSCLESVKQPKSSIKLAETVTPDRKKSKLRREISEAAGVTDRAQELELIARLRISPAKVATLTSANPDKAETLMRFTKSGTGRILLLVSTSMYIELYFVPMFYCLFLLLFYRRSSRRRCSARQ